MDLVIRNYENIDYEVVRKLLIDSFPEVDELLNNGLTDSDVLDLDKDRYIQLVACIDNNVVGYTLASRKDDPIMRRENLWIDYVCVNPNERGKGIARQLLQRIEEIAREEEVLNLELTSSRFRIGARKLYMDFGFVIRESDIFRKGVGLMLVVDIINKKRLGKELSYKELDFIFNGYLEGSVKDYQMSSLLMAICINGMTDEEIYALTKIFIDSGDILDFGDEFGIIVDKHSTGGIGDKTTMVIGPIVASCGVNVVKMSGRGLGYTGGTIDKFESIPGFKVNLSDEKILKQLKKIGLVSSAQTANLTPLDKVVYALRDVTGTVSSVPLIAASIMSKKIAAGADKILIDIKVGKGALIATKEEAKRLSELMIRIGEFYQKEVRCVISDMNTPLGYAVGNSLEVLEAIDVLKGKEYDNPFVDLCISLATDMVSMGKNISKTDAKIQVLESLNKGRAYEKFLELVKEQGGDLSKMTVAEKKQKVKADRDGVIKKIDALEVGKLSVTLGAGRRNKEDKIDHGVGVKLHHLVGEIVKKGDVLATLYVNERVDSKEYENIFEIK